MSISKRFNNESLNVQHHNIIVSELSRLSDVLQIGLVNHLFAVGYIKDGRV